MQHTRAATQEAASMKQSVATVDTSECQEETIISDDPVSPVFPRRSERHSQPQERYSPSLFFTHCSELTTYKEAMACANYANCQLAIESDNSIRENKTLDLVELLKNLHALPCRWVFRLKKISHSSSPN